MKQDISVSMIEANFYAVFATLPFIITIFGLYILIWKWRKFFDGLNLSFINLIICLIAIFTGIVIHELLHRLSWQFFGNKQFNTIKYGIDPKTLSPYAHCKEAIDIKAYRLGIAMPGLILGFLPQLRQF